MSDDAGDDDGKLTFPEDFLWGTATSSHQVEGDNHQNDWWAWEQVPGHIEDASTSGLASNWWQMAEQDLAIAAELGQSSHRLSLEWSRLQPTRDTWDERAVERYRQILGFMRERGLEPMVTLHHFTLPLWVREVGGWAREQIVPLFVEYTRRAVDAFGDLCHLWCTINEPMVYVAMGCVFGVWPPGRGGLRASGPVLRHMVRAHADAYHLIHRIQSQAQVGYAKHVRLFDPADPARWADRRAAGLVDYLFNEAALRAFDDGSVPLPFGRSLRRNRAEHLVDFLGLNYYSREMVAFDPHRRQDMYLHRFANPDAPFSMEGWGEIYSEGLYRSLKRLAAYGVPLYVTEFGIPDNTDSQRPRFIVEHVAAIHRAIREGVPVKGAYFWSLVDNFEWAAGWSARFGLIGLDPQTQERTVRQSAGVYGRIAAANGLERGLVEEVAPDLLPTLFPEVTAAEAGRHS